jgi:hypothetical protein
VAVRTRGHASRPPWIINRIVLGLLHSPLPVIYGRIVSPQEPGYEAAWQAYAQRQHLARQPGDRLLLVDVA